jgi:Ca-activated chloride channel homolog
MDFVFGFIIDDVASDFTSWSFSKQSSAMMFHLHFIRPLYALALIPLLYLFIRLIRYRYANKSWKPLCDDHLLNHVVSTNGKTYRGPFIIMMVITALLMVLALSGPAWSYWMRPVFQKSSVRFIAFDVSKSMDANDLKPSRIIRAKYKLIDLLRKINQGQTGMLVFSGQSFIVSPLTFDSQTVASMLPVINTDIVPVGGSNIGNALLKSAKMIHQAGFQKASIILFTDSYPDSSDDRIARRLSGEGIKTYVYGIGTTLGAPVPIKNGFMSDAKGNLKVEKLPVASLEKLADVGGGDYIPFTSSDLDIDTLFKLTKATQNERNEKHNRFDKFWQDQGHLFIWLLAVLIALLARRGWLEALCA